MAAPSLLEKISILLEVSKSSIFFIIALALMVFFGLVLITTNRMNVKSSRKLFILLYVFILVSIFTIYKDSISQMIEYLMNNLFQIIYFPNLAVYFAAIIIINIILWFSVFNFKTPTIIKNINIVVYLIISYLLVVLLSIVNSQKLDVFNQTSIYSNRSAQAIIELSSMLFITWIILLILYKAIMVYLTRDKVSVMKFNNKNIKTKVKNNQRKLPKNIIEIPTPYKVKTLPASRPVIRKNNDISAYEKMLTKDDYKLLINILKEKKEEKRLEELKKQKHEKELDKFRELQELYGVR